MQLTQIERLSAARRIRQFVLATIFIIDALADDVTHHAVCADYDRGTTDELSRVLCARLRDLGDQVVAAETVTVDAIKKADRLDDNWAIGATRLRKPEASKQVHITRNELAQGLGTPLNFILSRVSHRVVVEVQVAEAKPLDRFRLDLGLA